MLWQQKTEKERLALGIRLRTFEYFVCDFEKSVSILLSIFLERKWDMVYVNIRKFFHVSFSMISLLELDKCYSFTLASVWQLLREIDREACKRVQWNRADNKEIKMFLAWIIRKSISDLLNYILIFICVFYVVDSWDTENDVQDY